MILPIYIYGHPVLRAENAIVTPDFEGLNDLIENMKETMYHTQGIGIAAPQVGVNARIVFIDVDPLAEDFPELKDVRMLLINPQITIDKRIIDPIGNMCNESRRYPSTGRTKTSRNMTRTLRAIWRAWCSMNATIWKRRSLWIAFRPFASSSSGLN